MAPPFSRASRLYEFVAAAGSSVEVKTYDASYNLTPPEPAQGVVFDIETGILVDTYKNQNTTNSGCNGGEDWTRVGGAWSYVLTLSFPAALIGGELAAAFAQQLLASSRKIWMRFNMGEPTDWIAGTARSFVGRRSLLSAIEQRWDTGPGTNVVGLNIAGVGSSLLRAMYGDTQVHP